MTDFRAKTNLPPLVARATALAEQHGFTRSCTPEVGRLLRVLAAQVRAGTVAEIGTGVGVGAAWLASALSLGVALVTVEADAVLAEVARHFLRDMPDVRVLAADWRDLLPYGPFALLFADVTDAKATHPELLVHALAPGGVIVLDDLTPEDQWPPEWRGQRDPVRDFWLNDPRLVATEILLTPTTAAILAVRVL
jgi:predicted O-methyltransferase YrrM